MYVGMIPEFSKSLYINNEGPDQTVWMQSLFRAFAVQLFLEELFSHSMHK